MTEFYLTIPMEPVAKGRPRLGRGHTYTPQKTVDAEEFIQTVFLEKYPRSSPLLGVNTAIHLEVVFHKTFPKSMSKSARKTAWATSRPDLDNYIKLLTDALNGLAWGDDSQIVSMYIAKKYADAPLIELKAKTINHLRSQTAL